jgi:hypothetical protein
MSQLYAEVRADEATPELLATLKGLGYSIRFTSPTNGKVAPAPAPTPEVEVVAVNGDAWINVAEYECPNEFIAWSSSNGIKRHLAGECKCKAEGKTCNALNKAHVAADEFNTRPGVSLVKDEAKQVFTLA